MKGIVSSLQLFKRNFGFLPVGLTWVPEPNTGADGMPSVSLS